MDRGVILLGPPGGGKGTHAGRLAEEAGVPHIAIGDMLRREVAVGTALGREAGVFMNEGRLVPDALAVRIAVARLSQPDARAGWILDGFPRNLAQARSLEDSVEDGAVDVVVVLEVPDEEVFDRISGRRTCRRGHVYHVTRNPPRVPGVCDVDGESLFQRDDARAKIVRRRLAIYKRETHPLLQFYEQRGLLRRVDGMGTVEDVYQRVLAAACS